MSWAPQEVRLKDNTSRKVENKSVQSPILKLNSDMEINIDTTRGNSADAEEAAGIIFSRWMSKIPLLHVEISNHKIKTIEEWSKKQASENHPENLPDHAPWTFWVYANAERYDKVEINDQLQHVLALDKIGKLVFSLFLLGFQLHARNDPDEMQKRYRICLHLLATLYPNSDEKAKGPAHAVFFVNYYPYIKNQLAQHDDVPDPEKEIVELKNGGKLYFFSSQQHRANFTHTDKSVFSIVNVNMSQGFYVQEEQKSKQRLFPTPSPNALFAFPSCYLRELMRDLSNEESSNAFRLFEGIETCPWKNGLQHGVVPGFERYTEVFQKIKKSIYA